MAKTLNNSNGMPQMHAAFVGWFSKITLGIITQTVDDDGNVSTTINNVSFDGTIQPLQTEDLELKPEGLRNWRWLQIHCFSGDLNLNNDDKITYKNIRYKIMGVKDYSLNGFIEYHSIQDYE